MSKCYFFKHSPKILISLPVVLPILALSACNNNSTEKPQETSAVNVQLDLIKDGTSDYTAHGSIDPIVPVAGTREMVAALEKAGSTVFTYNELRL